MFLKEEKNMPVIDLEAEKLNNLNHSAFSILNYLENSYNIINKGNFFR